MPVRRAGSKLVGKGRSRTRRDGQHKLTLLLDHSWTKAAGPLVGPGWCAADDLAKGAVELRIRCQDRTFTFTLQRDKRFTNWDNLTGSDLSVYLESVESNHSETSFPLEQHGGRSRESQQSMASSTVKARQIAPVSGDVEAGSSKRDKTIRALVPKAPLVTLSGHSDGAGSTVNWQERDNLAQSAGVGTVVDPTPSAGTPAKSSTSRAPTQTRPVPAPNAIVNEPARADNGQSSGRTNRHQPVSPSPSASFTREAKAELLSSPDLPKRQSPRPSCTVLPTRFTEVPNVIDMTVDSDEEAQSREPSLPSMSHIFDSPTPPSQSGSSRLHSGEKLVVTSPPRAKANLRETRAVADTSDAAPSIHGEWRDADVNSICSASGPMTMDMDLDSPAPEDASDGEASMSQPEEARNLADMTSLSDQLRLMAFDTDSEVDQSETDYNHADMDAIPAWDALFVDRQGNRTEYGQNPLDNFQTQTRVLPASNHDYVILTPLPESKGSAASGSSKMNNTNPVSTAFNATQPAAAATVRDSNAQRPPDQRSLGPAIAGAQTRSPAADTFTFSFPLPSPPPSDTSGLLTPISPDRNPAAKVKAKVKSTERAGEKGHDPLLGQATQQVAATDTVSRPGFLPAHSPTTVRESDARLPIPPAIANSARPSGPKSIDRSTPVAPITAGRSSDTQSIEFVSEDDNAVRPTVNSDRQPAGSDTIAHAASMTTNTQPSGQPAKAVDLTPPPISREHPTPATSPPANPFASLPHRALTQPSPVPPFTISPSSPSPDMVKPPNCALASNITSSSSSDSTRQSPFALTPRPSRPHIGLPPDMTDIASSTAHRVARPFRLSPDPRETLAPTDIATYSPAKATDAVRPCGQATPSLAPRSAAGKTTKNTASRSTSSIIVDTSAQAASSKIVTPRPQSEVAKRHQAARLPLPASKSTMKVSGSATDSIVVQYPSSAVSSSSSARPLLAPATPASVPNSSPDDSAAVELLLDRPASPHLDQLGTSASTNAKPRPKGHTPENELVERLSKHYTISDLPIPH